MKKLQYLRPVRLRTKVFNDDDVIGLGLELCLALCQVQDTIGGDRELRFLQLLHTGINRVRVAMYKKGADRTPSVERRGPRGHTYTIRRSCALSQT